MKNLFAILVVSISAVGCSLSDEQKVKKEIKNYLDKELDNPTSYTPIDFKYFEVDSTSKENNYSILHKFNVKNEKEEEIEEVFWFFISSEFKIIGVIDLKEGEKKRKKQLKELLNTQSKGIISSER